MDMKQRIHEQVVQIQPELIGSIQHFIAIPSVLEEPTPHAPFGQPIATALAQMLDLCESFGMRTVNVDGYYGYAEYGEGEELIGILGHLDVVPVGELTEWETNPFEGVIRDGKLIGRGSQDDKGPTLAALYALQALRASGIVFNKRIRFIFGTDEESLWRDIAKYHENNEEIPKYGFTPDASFPLIHAEKGLLQATIKVKESGVPFQFESGEAMNSVPARATYIGSKVESIGETLTNMNLAYSLDGNKMSVYGKSRHAQAADKGTNPALQLLQALKVNGITSKTVDFLVDGLGDDANGRNIIPNCYDDVSGKLTVNVGKVSINETEQVIGLDIRIPVTYDKLAIVEPLQVLAAKYGMVYEEYDWLAPVYVPEDHFLVKTLMDVYSNITGDTTHPLTSGGATYARALDNCVAFGMVFPTSEKTEHQPNEYILLADLEKATYIYACAIAALLSTDSDVDL